MLPVANGILIEPAPQGTSADLGHQTAPGHFPNQILAAVTGQRLAAVFGQFAGDGFDLHSQFRGKNWADARSEEGFPILPIVLQKSVCAIC